MNYKAIFFDWDGVITDSVNIKTDAYVDIFSDFGQEIQEKVKAHHLQNGGMSRFEKFKIYYKEFLGVEIDETKIQELSNEFSSLVMKKVAAAPFVEGAVETIREQYAKGTKLFVVTGTPTDEMKEIAKLKGLYNYFIEFCGSPTKKSMHTANLIKKYNLIPQKCLFIGDAMADYTAAHENNVNFLGIKIQSCKTEFPTGTKIEMRVNI